MVVQCQAHFAVTGDAVSDAIALKHADIGIAMDSSSDIVKHAADLILLNNNFATIAAAVQESRGIHKTIQKIIAFFLPISAVVLLILFARIYL
jgi:cation-transporting P-type ATPase F